MAETAYEQSERTVPFPSYAGLSAGTSQEIRQLNKCDLDHTSE